MNLVREVLTSLFLPLSFAVEILIVGTILLWWSGRQKAAKMLVTAGAVLLILIAYRPVPYLLLVRLESRFPPLELGSATDSTRIDSVRWVAVLGGGHNANTRFPSSSRLSSSSLARLVEGIRLYRLIPGSRLLLSGGGGSDRNSDAGVMADVALALGVTRNDIVTETRSTDTEDQAEKVSAIVKTDKTILVTSAAHMPRAMALFGKLGVHPVPAPTDYMMKGGTVTPGTFYPSDQSLAQTKLALHEYLGTIWARMRGRI